MNSLSLSEVFPFRIFHIIPYCLRFLTSIHSLTNSQLMVWKNSPIIFLYILLFFIEILNPYRDHFLSQTLPQKASLNKMTPLRKSASQAAAAASSKGKSIAVGNSDPIDAHPPPPRDSHRGCQGRPFFPGWCTRGRDQRAWNPAPRRKATPPNAPQPPKRIGWATGGGSSWTREGRSRET